MDDVVQIQSVLRTRPQIEADLKQWKSYGNKGGEVAAVVTSGDAQEWMRYGLNEYVRSQGHPVTGDVQKDIDNIARGMGEEYLASQGVQVSLRFRNLEEAGVNIASAGVTYATGVDPQLVSMSAGSLADAKLSPDEIHGICALAGSIAGAAVGQAFGIPAPIGAWVGGIIGDSIGSVVVDMFNIGAAAARREKSQQEQKLRLAALEESRWKAIIGCTGYRIAYWQAFDEILVAIERQWQKLEVEAGYRFHARWFGPTGSYMMSNMRWQTHASGCKVKGKSRDCCPYEFGCPYPDMSDQGAGHMERAARLFAARGFKWPKCTERVPCSIREVPAKCGEDSSRGAQCRSGYLAELRHWASGNEFPMLASSTVMRSEQTQFHKLDQVTTLVVNDLMKTASAVKGEILVANDRERLAKYGLDADEQARRAALIASNKRRAFKRYLVNYGTLGLGLGALGAALYGRRAG